MDITATPEGTMTATIEQLADLILTQSRARLADKYSQQQADAETVQIRPGRVYVKIDRGPAHNISGMLMVEVATGNIYGIRGYGQVHKGHFYGTLDTIADWYWGDYYPVRRRPLAPAPTPVAAPQAPAPAAQQAPAGMQVTIVHTSNGGARVHKAGCGDILRREMRRRDYLSRYTMTAVSRRAAALDAWADFLPEGMTEADAMGYTVFLPCCAGLPAEAPAA